MASSEEAYRAGDHAKALEILKPLAEKGEVLAQYRLGYMLALGQGAEKDLKLAAEWMRKAADQGDAAALTQLGVFYLQGAGVERSET
jgi:TPR repeat protein